MKHLFLYSISTLLVAILLINSPSHAALTRVETIAHVGKSLLMPWKATRAFNSTVSDYTTALAVVASVCDWAQPLKPQGDKKEKEAYRKALKEPSMRHWVSFYNAIWFLKKGVACNELYRISTRFHWDSRNPLEYIVSLLKIITIFGDRIIPEQIEKASKKLWGTRAKQPKDNSNSPKE